MCMCVCKKQINFPYFYSNMTFPAFFKREKRETGENRLLQAAPRARFTVAD